MTVFSGPCTHRRPDETTAATPDRTTGQDQPDATTTRQKHTVGPSDPIANAPVPAYGGTPTRDSGTLFWDRDADTARRIATEPTFTVALSGRREHLAAVRSRTRLCLEEGDDWEGGHCDAGDGGGDQGRPARAELTEDSL
jgi:hypothetical protein